MDTWFRASLFPRSKLQTVPQGSTFLWKECFQETVTRVVKGQQKKQDLIHAGPGFLSESRLKTKNFQLQGLQGSDTY